MTELGLCAITIKKYKPHSNKKIAEDLMTNDLVIKALKNAYYKQNPDENKPLIFHTDLGLNTLVII